MRCGSHHALVNCCAPPANLLTLTPLSLLPFSFCVSQPSSTLSSQVFSLIFQVSFLTLFFSSAPHTLLKVPVFSLFQSSFEEVIRRNVRTILFVRDRFTRYWHELRRYFAVRLLHYSKEGLRLRSCWCSPYIPTGVLSLLSSFLSLSLSLSLSFHGSHLTWFVTFPLYTIQKALPFLFFQVSLNNPFRKTSEKSCHLLTCALATAVITCTNQM